MGSERVLSNTTLRVCETCIEDFLKNLEEDKIYDETGIIRDMPKSALKDIREQMEYQRKLGIGLD